MARFQTVGGTYPATFEQDFIYERNIPKRFEMEDGTLRFFDDGGDLRTYPVNHRFVIPYVQCVTMNYGADVNNEHLTKLKNYISSYIDKVQYDYQRNLSLDQQRFYVLNIYYGTGTFVNPNKDRGDSAYQRYQAQEEYRNILVNFLNLIRSALQSTVDKFEHANPDDLLELRNIINQFAFDWDYPNAKKRNLPDFIHRYTHRGMYRHLFAHVILETIINKVIQYLPFAPEKVTNRKTAVLKVTRIARKYLSPDWASWAYKQMHKHFLQRFHINFVLIPTPGEQLSRGNAYLVPPRRNPKVLTVQGVYNQIQHILSYVINWLDKKGLFPRNMAEAKRAEILKTLINNFYIMIMKLLTSTQSAEENRQLIDRWIESVVMQFFTGPQEEVNRVCGAIVNEIEFKKSLYNFDAYLDLYMRTYFQNLIFAIVSNISKGYSRHNTNYINFIMDHLVISEFEFNCHLWTTPFVKFSSFLNPDMAQLDNTAALHHTSILYRYYVRTTMNQNLRFWHLYYIEEFNRQRQNTVNARPPATKPPKRRNTNEALQNMDIAPRGRRGSQYEPLPPAGPPPGGRSRGRLNVNFSNFAPRESVMSIIATNIIQQIQNIFPQLQPNINNNNRNNEPITSRAVGGPTRTPRGQGK